MSMVKQVNPAALSAWVDRLIARQLVYGVQAKGDWFAFGRYRPMTFAWISMSPSCRRRSCFNRWWKRL